MHFKRSRPRYLTQLPNRMQSFLTSICIQDVSQVIRTISPFSISCFRFHVWSYRIQTSHDEYFAAQSVLGKRKRSRCLSKIMHRDIKSEIVSSLVSKHIRDLRVGQLVLEHKVHWGLRTFKFTPYSDRPILCRIKDTFLKDQL